MLVPQKEFIRRLEGVDQPNGAALRTCSKDLLSFLQACRSNEKLTHQQADTGNFLFFFFLRPLVRCNLTLFTVIDKNSWEES